ncbi:MAG: aminotransferase class III-fold pyridoxal phosphate-dependent enzyme [Aquisalimonadaceae bacterium]
MNSSRNDSAEAAYFRDHVNPTVANILSLLRLDRHYVRGEGSLLYDADGRRHVDFVAGYGAVAFGHGPAFLDAALHDHLTRREPGLVQPSVLGPAARLARRLTELAPAGLTYAWFSNSGAEAVEAALKACRAATGRPGVVYTQRSFHGKTLGALSATGAEKYQQPFFARLPDYHAVPYGDLAALRTLLAERAAAIACVILEPIQGEGGIVVPPDGYLRGVRELCDRHDVLLVLDEVQTGPTTSSTWTHGGAFITSAAPTTCSR